MLENIKFIIGIIVLILYFGIVPSVIGIAGSSIFCPKRKVSVTEAYIWGNIILWVIFQLLCVPMGIMGISFTVLTITFLVIILVLFICILSLQRKRISERIHIAIRTVRDLSWKEWLVITLILGQTCVSVFGATYIGADDAGYMAISLDAVEKNAIASIDYYTGLPSGVPLKILLTSWNYYISFLAKISGIHVTAIAHTFLPIVLIPMAYGVYLLLARVLFHYNRSKVVAFLFWVNLLVIFGGYSWYTLTLRLDICIWHGKAVMATVMLPFLLYYLLGITEYQKRDLVCLMFIMIATCAMSLMGVGLSILIVVGVIVAKYQRNSIKKSFPLLLAVVFISFVAVFYFFKMYSINEFSFERVKELFPKATDMALGAYSLYWNGTWLRWFYYICLGYLLLRKKNKQGKTLTRYIIWQYLVIFNPLVYYIAYLFLQAENVYVRLYYMLFPEIFMAYILTLLVFDFKEKKNRIICVIVCGVVIMVLGKPYGELAEFSKPQNIYKLPQEIIELCDMINADSPDEAPRAIVYQGDVRDRGPIVYIRQYSSRIQMLYGRAGYVYKGNQIFDLIEKNEITMSEIGQLMEENNCRYLVWKYNQNDITEMENLGGNIVGKTENYVVIRMDFEVEK